MNKRIRDKILENGIKNLKTFGYLTVNKENIFTDYIYSQFFEGMLKDNLGQGFDEEINDLLNNIKTEDIKGYFYYQPKEA